MIYRQIVGIHCWINAKKYNGACVIIYGIVVIFVCDSARGTGCGIFVKLYFYHADMHGLKYSRKL